MNIYSLIQKCKRGGHKSNPFINPLNLMAAVVFILFVPASLAFTISDYYAYYSMDSSDIIGGNPTDLTGHGYNTTNVGGNIGSNGAALNEAITFTNTEYLVFKDADFFEGLTETTIYFFVESNNTVGNCVLVSKFWDGTNRGFLMSREAAGYVFYRQSTDSQNDNDQASYTFAFTPNRVYFMAFVWNGTGDDNIVIYMDGNMTGAYTPKIQPGVTTRTNNAQPLLNANYNTMIDTTTSCNFTFDEVAFMTKALTQEEIQALYFNYTTLGISPFGIADTTPPEIALVYPVNNTHYNDFNGSIVFNTNEDANCSVNNTNWVNVTGFTSAHRFDYIPTPNGGYNLTVSCTDIFSNTGTITFYFAQDNQKPVIENYFPLNLTKSNQYEINFSTSCSDNIALWDMNITIIYENGTVYYTHFITNISLNQDVTYISYSEIVNVSEFPDGNYTLYIKCSDSHTDQIIGVSLGNEKEYNTLENYKTLLFSFPDGTINNIDVVYPKDTNINFNVESYKVSADIITGKEAYYYVKGENIEYLKNSIYPCHLISNRIWSDCVGLINPIVTKISDNTYRINYDSIGIDNIKSFGILNEIEQESEFLLDREKPIINITYPENNTDYNSIENYIEIYLNEKADCRVNDSYLLTINDSLHKIWSYTPAYGDYEQYINCTDIANNTGYAYLVYGYLKPSIETNVSVDVDILPLALVAVYIALVFFSIKSDNTVFKLFSMIFGIGLGIYLLSSTPIMGFVIVVFSVYLPFHKN